MTDPISSPNPTTEAIKDAPAFFVTHILENALELLPATYYRKLLGEIGLSQFERELPANNFELVASYDQTAQLIAKVYERMDETIFTLFAQNLGTGNFKMISQTAGMQKLKAMVKPIFDDVSLTLEEKLQFFVERIRKILYVKGQSLSIEGKALTIENINCPYCRAIKTDKMVCFAEKTFHTANVKWMTGWVFQAEQYQSVTRGDAACGIRFTPLI